MIAIRQSRIKSRPLSKRGSVVIAIMAFALLVRLAHWWVVCDKPFVAQLVVDSREYDRWAREIAAGAWLGSQVFFQAPLYPYFLALLYALFGRNLDVVYLAQIGIAVGGCYALYRAGREMAGGRVGLAAAGLAAAYGPFIFYDVQLLKESLAVSTTCFLLWTLTTLKARPASWRWVTAGVLLGILTLLRENALLVIPFLLPLAWGGEGGRLGPVRRGGLLMFGLALALAPIALRNGAVGGDFLPTTSQGGVNLYIGNNAAADGTYRPIVSGRQVPALERREQARLAEAASGRRLTPTQVSSYWMGRAVKWAAANPGAFCRLQWRKLGMFWSWYEWPDAVDYYYVKTLSPVLRSPLMEFGAITLLAALGLWLVRRRLGPFAPALLFMLGWTVSTVIFFLFSRYRLPAVPSLMLLSAVPIAELAEAPWRPRTGAEAGVAVSVVAKVGLALVCALAVAIPQLVRFSPRMDLVHYNLALLDEENGRTQEARAHYLSALSSDPNNFLACLNLGNQAAIEKDWQTALDFYARAAAIRPGSDDVQCNLGGVFLGLGRLEEAETHLDLALRLNPTNLNALLNEAVLCARRGELERAKELSGRVLELEPENAAALRLSRDIAQAEAEGRPHRAPR